MDEGKTESFKPVKHVATQLGVPAAWLRREAAAGRLPHLRAGRRILVNRTAIEKALARLAERAAEGGRA